MRAKRTSTKGDSGTTNNKNTYRRRRGGVLTVEPANDDGHFGDREEGDDDDVADEVERGEHEGEVEAALVPVVFEPCQALNDAAIAFSPLGAVLAKK